MTGSGVGRVLTVGGLFFGVALIVGLRSPGPPDPRREPQEHASQARATEVRSRFDAAVLMLHARQFDHAVTALHRVLELEPRLPEAHVNMGYALLGLQQHVAARDFFNGAIELAPGQANAYHGLALAWEGLGDLRMAIGAMRSYLHLARDERDVHLRRARAALWEWETQLRPQQSPQPQPPR
jgi:Tfp pilus assembly protein PilF